MRTAESHGAFQRFQRGEMDLARPIRSMLRAVIPPPAHDQDAVACPLHELDDERQPFENGRRLARC